MKNNSKYNSVISKSGNIIWAGALGLAWKELIQTFVQEPIKLRTVTEIQEQLVTNFNTLPFSKKDLDPLSYYIKCGKGQETVSLINSESKKKFPNKSFSDLDIKLAPMDIISYAYFCKVLEFEHAFKRQKDKQFKFNDKLTHSFRAAKDEQKKQINCFYYKNQSDFCVSIDTKNPKDQIFFIMSEKITKVDEAIDIVLKQAESGKSQKLSGDDLFEMPIVEFDITRNMKELQTLDFQNKKMEGYFLAQIFEGIKLKIDEKGAKVENQGVVVAYKMMKKPSTNIKKIILNKPFWVVMKEKGKLPYLCSYVVNPTEKLQI